MRFFYLLVLAAGLVSCGQKATSPVELFNGEDLAGWVAVTADSTAASPFSVADGCIRVAGEPFGYLRTAEPYGDYGLRTAVCSSGSRRATASGPRSSSASSRRVMPGICSP